MLKNCIPIEIDDPKHTNYDIHVFSNLSDVEPLFPIALPVLLSEFTRLTASRRCSSWAWETHQFYPTNAVCANRNHKRWPDNADTHRDHHQPQHHQPRPSLARPTATGREREGGWRRIKRYPGGGRGGGAALPAAVHEFSCTQEQLENIGF